MAFDWNVLHSKALVSTRMSLIFLQIKFTFWETQKQCPLISTFEISADHPHVATLTCSIAHRVDFIHSFIRPKWLWLQVVKVFWWWSVSTCERWTLTTCIRLHKPHAAHNQQPNKRNCFGFMFSETIIEIETFLLRSLDEDLEEFLVIRHWQWD